jgi:hypothetical protein
MKKVMLLIKRLCTVSSAVVLIFIFSSCKKVVFDFGSTNQFSIQSVNNGANYYIKVGLPFNYTSSTEKYATIYVLDGDENFDFVASECRKISDKYGIKNILVVSIGYGNDRSIDYTPTKISTTTGGAEQFLNFIETQLIPKIEQNFRADTTRTSRIILGHSYGGLFGAYAYSVNNKLFGNYILLSPSLWFDNLISLQLEKDHRADNKNRKQLVFMGLGELENYGKMQAPFEAFYQTIRDNYTNSKVIKNLEKDLDHLGSKNPNISMGLDYYFKNR